MLCLFGQALLDEWRAELARKPLGMSEAEACAILEIQFDGGVLSAGGQEASLKLEEETLKAAYRRLARRCVTCPKTMSWSVSLVISATCVPALSAAA